MTRNAPQPLQRAASTDPALAHEENMSGLHCEPSIRTAEDFYNSSQPPLDTRSERERSRPASFWASSVNDESAWDQPPPRRAATTKIVRHGLPSAEQQQQQQQYQPQAYDMQDLEAGFDAMWKSVDGRAVHHYNDHEEEKPQCPPPRPPKHALPRRSPSPQKEKHFEYPDSPEAFEPYRNVRSFSAEEYAKPFCDFLTNNPTVFHAVNSVAKGLEAHGYKRLSERGSWKLQKGGLYYIERNGSSLIAFAVGDNYEPGNGAAVVAGHIDALTARLKPIPKLQSKGGYVQLGVAPYAGALNNTWWDRDLGVGGRVLVKDGSGKIQSKLVKLDWPIARIPSLAPHFGSIANGPHNPETQMVPIIGLDSESTFDASESANNDEWKPTLLGGAGSFASTQPEKLVRAISKQLSINASDIINWELELFDIQPATIGGIEKEFIFGGRVDDKLCSWGAYQALLNSTVTSNSTHPNDESTRADSDSSTIKVVGLFDDEEVGSLLRQGANGNFLPAVLSRVIESFPSDSNDSTASLLSRTYASSFLVSSDVTHALNPNFLSAYLPHHSPQLNTGLVLCFDSNAHMTTDSISSTLLTSCLSRSNQRAQVFQIRNDVRSGGTVGPMLSAKTGMRAIDAGMPQLSMHSIRATTGVKDPGLGVLAFQAFFDHFENVDAEFGGVSTQRQRGDIS